MNYKALASINNKPTYQWTSSDVTKWLAFIGHENLASHFCEAGVDGSILGDLEPQDLENELGVKSKIIRKKIMNWVEKGFSEFNQLFMANKENICLNNISQPLHQNFFSKVSSITQLVQPAFPTQRIQSTECDVEAQPILSSLSSYSAPTHIPMNIERNRQLIISPQEGTPQSSTFCISENGGKIGRHSSNSILVLEESVSRHHAEINYDKGADAFMLSDLKSSTGTFIKIKNRMPLEVGITIQMGSYHLLVDAITITPDFAEIMFKIVEGVAPSQEIKFTCKPGTPNSFKIGRQSTNQVCFPDTHLSGIHAVVSFLSNTFMIEDMSSTNGTWMRLKSGEPSMLTNDSVFKVGNVCIYSCRYSDIVKTEQSNSNSNFNCIVCVVNDRDAVCMPCKHNLLCVGCSKQVKRCPVCRMDVEESIRIYK